MACNSDGDDTAAREYLKNFPEIQLRQRSYLMSAKMAAAPARWVIKSALATLSDQQLSEIVPKPAITNRLTAHRAVTVEIISSSHGPFRLTLEFQFKGKVAVLISAATYSVAEDFAGGLLII